MGSYGAKACGSERSSGEVVTRMRVRMRAKKHKVFVQNPPKRPTSMIVAPNFHHQFASNLLQSHSSQAAHTSHLSFQPSSRKASHHTSHNSIHHPSPHHPSPHHPSPHHPSPHHPSPHHPSPHPQHPDLPSYFTPFSLTTTPPGPFQRFLNFFKRSSNLRRNFQSELEISKYKPFKSHLLSSRHPQDPSNSTTPSSTPPPHTQALPPSFPPQTSQRRIGSKNISKNSEKFLTKNSPKKMILENFEKNRDVLSQRRKMEKIILKSTKQPELILDKNRNTFYTVDGGRVGCLNFNFLFFQVFFYIFTFFHWILYYIILYYIIL